MRQDIRSILMMLAVCISPAMDANAVPLTVLNPSFENPGTASETFTANATNWSFYNTGPDPQGNDRISGVWRPGAGASFIDPVPNGVNVGVVFLNIPGNTSEAGMQQTLAATLLPSTQYTLTVDVGNFAPVAGPYNFTGFPGYRVDLLAGGVVIASDNNTLAPGEGRFLTSTTAFTTGVSHPNLGQALGIRLVNLNGTGVEVNFDRVSLDAVPEPSTAALAGGAALMVMTRRRRRGVPPTGT